MLVITLFSLLVIFLFLKKVAQKHLVVVIIYVCVKIKLKPNLLQFIKIMRYFTPYFITYSKIKGSCFTYLKKKAFK